MNNIGKITKYAFKEQFFPYFPNKTLANYPKNYFGRILLFAISYILYGVFFYYFQKITGEIYLNKPEGGITYFTMFGVAITLMVVFFYIPRIISDFFSDKNSRIYRTLPISEGELFIGKLLGAILSYVDFYVFLLVALIVYFLKKGFDLGVLLLSIINLFSLISIPYTILAGLILVVMKYTNAASHRKFFKNLGYVILFLIVGAYYYFSFNFGKKAGSGQDTSILNTAIGGLSQVSDAFFNAKFFGMAVAGTLSQKLIYTLILLAISALLIFLVYKFANKYYFESITEKDGVGEAKKKPSKTKKVGLTQKSPIYAIAKRDFKNLFSNIVFLTVPIMFILIFGIMGFSIGREIISEVDLSFYPGGTVRFWMFLAGFIFGMLVWVNSGFGTQGLSREHSSFYLFQTLPIKPSDHFMGRLVSSLLASSIFNLALAVFMGFAMGLGFLNTLFLFFGLSAGAILSSVAGIYLGTKSINTSWKKPEELTKGGVRFLIYYLISLVLAVLLIVAYIFILNLTQAGHNLASGLLLVFIAIMIAIFTNLGIDSYKDGFMDVK